MLGFIESAVRTPQQRGNPFVLCLYAGDSHTNGDVERALVTNEHLLGDPRTQPLGRGS